MYKVFNMGHRMELYVDEEMARPLIELSTSFGVDAQVIGRVEASESKRVTLHTPHGEFDYM